MHSKRTVVWSEHLIKTSIEHMNTKNIQKLTRRCASFTCKTCRIVLKNQKQKTSYFDSAMNVLTVLTVDRIDHIDCIDRIDRIDCIECEQCDRHDRIERRDCVD